MKAFALLSVVPRATDAMLERIAAAARVRLPELDAAWRGIYGELAAPMDVRIVTRVADLTNDDVPMLFKDDIGDPDALAFHSIQDFHAYGLILAREDQTDADIENSAGHEILECRLDPSCTLYANRVALECQDPLEGDVDPVDIGTSSPVPFSPFTLPAYFQFPGATGSTNSAGLALAPLTARPKGYIIRDDGTESFGRRYAKKPHRGHFHTRRSRRLRAQPATPPAA